MNDNIFVPCWNNCSTANVLIAVERLLVDQIIYKCLIWNFTEVYSERVVFRGRANGSRDCPRFEIPMAVKMFILVLPLEWPHIDEQCVL